MEHFFEVLMPIAVIGSFAVIIKIMLDARTRNKLIDKGLVDEKVKYLFSRYHGPEQRKLSNLKWGMVLVGIGLAALLAFDAILARRKEATEQ